MNTLTRNTSNGHGRAPAPDRLPPHSTEAEQGVLGCVLKDPQTLLECEKRFGSDIVFYELRHQELYQSLCNMHREGLAIDLITLQDRLRGMSKLEQIGGVGYLCELQDGVTSTANLPSWMDIVWEKFLARQQVQTSVSIVQQIYEWNGLPEGLWASITRSRLEWEEKTTRGAGEPRELIDPLTCYEEFLDEWHNRRAELHGWELPFPLADYRMHLNEMSILVGDSGSGKSTWLSEVAIKACQQGAKACIASFEMPRRKLLKLMVRQLLGTNYVPPGPEGEATLREAIGWLQGKVRLYNFLGIADWRRVLDVFTYAHDHGGSNFFVLDNLGLIGIGDEDWEQQQAAMAAFKSFAHVRPIHLWAVQHINKSDGNFKQKVRGSKRATDFVDNAFEWLRNDKKKDKIAEILAEAETNKPKKEKATPKAISDWKAAKDKELEPQNSQWDGKIILRKHRHDDGEQQNCSRYLRFDWRSKQFRPREQEESKPINYLTGQTCGEML